MNTRACSTYGHSCYGAHGKKSMGRNTPRLSENYKTEEEFLMSDDPSLEENEMKPKLQKYLLLNILLDKDDLNDNINEISENIQEESNNGIKEIEYNINRPSYKFKTPLKKRKFLYRINQPVAAIKPISTFDDFASPYKFLIKPKRIQNHDFINNQLQSINSMDDLNETNIN
ncbi:uncharacterized protein LOC129612173 isoform X2 [Condylostylus longicornis]|uniref:uncharacterized protein LOC129612173 isoform X2 n=1 Tax=Condylostylus longicornis TaxID=2530218 RepID=UPI00244DB400|nr:uncharacterized protein LOC129612173 isoform X2 [Condylostylus longicornis]